MMFTWESVLVINALPNNWINMDVLLIPNPEILVDFLLEDYEIDGKV